MAIAVFDSGMGGLTVLHEAMGRIPGETFIYYADTLHVPYGTKPKEFVRDCVLTSVRAIMEQPEPVRAVVVACNTATSIAIGALRETYPDIPIIGMEPAVKPAVELIRGSGKRVLVTATPLTLQESKYHELVKRVDDQAIVDSLPLPELVRFCEELRFEGEEIEAYFRERFAGLRLADYGTIVLGCTHFPFYRRALARVLPSHIRMIDGSRGTVKRLREVLGASEKAENGKGGLRFMSSGGGAEYETKLQTALRRYDEMVREAEAEAKR
ncbi:glutamate racemase [Paenibacillus sp.]|uniref:glutamate racemase n=1 Tax=Paenibacillus sp. TaxID=58172 RepID=UPI002D6A3DF3|nr:glutamate racemase [Paenibacillus sp.]HZG86745.1 glutamate racemase [Paenibacillus sp.]